MSAASNGGEERQVSRTPMSPWLEDADVTLYHGDVLTTLRELSAESVDCVVTSPPYWGLRDYGQEGQLGLEPTPEQYVERMVEVFREVRRVLAAHGTVWLNLGDSYASQGGPQVPQTKQHTGSGYHGTNRNLPELKPKDLVGVPWRVAFALQADGWYLRSDIIWSKPNPMPESVTDRPTKAHEYVFLLSKQPRYFFDQEAVREAHAYDWTANAAAMHKQNRERRARVDEANGGILNVGGRDSQYANGPHPAGRNIRSVWEIATQPYPEAHFATFPEELARRCIAAGCPERGVVLDPFIGSGTVAYVARKLGRHAVGIDLSEEYLELAAKRLQQQSLFAEMA